MKFVVTFIIILISSSVFGQQKKSTLKDKTFSWYEGIFNEVESVQEYISPLLKGDKWFLDNKIVTNDMDVDTFFTMPVFEQEGTKDTIRIVAPESSSKQYLRIITPTVSSGNN